MNFRPCIDLHDGKVKQIIGSTLNASETPETNFISEKAGSYFADMYRRDNLYGGHVIMLGANNEAAALEAVRAFPGGLQVGGGLNGVNGKIYLDNGASHLIFTSFVFADGELKIANLDEICRSYGKKRIVLDLSCRAQNDGNYYIVSDRWQKFTSYKINRENLELLSKYADEFLIHAVDIEGKQGGTDEKLISMIAEYSPIKTVYAGGIRNLNDVDFIEKTGSGKIDFTIGSALDIFGGKLKYRDIIEFCQKRNKK